MSAPLGVALIGAGAIGALRAAAVDKAEDFRLVAVADPRQEAARRLARRHGGEALAEAGAAVTTPGVDVAIISTPPNRHAEPALAAIAAGKHVLCEKPLAESVAAGQQLCEAAEAAQVVLQTGFNHRHLPAVAAARELVERGAIGDVVEVRARGGHQGGEEFGHDWVHDPDVTGGGSLVDNGIHLLDLVRFFFGEVDAAKGYVANLIWPFAGAEDTALAMFRDNGGRVATLEAVWTEWRGYGFSIEAVGTSGFVKASYPPMLLEWGSSAGRGRKARRRWRLFPLFQLRERLRGWQWTIVESLVVELAGLARAVREGVPPPASGRDGLRALQMADAVYRSAREGTEIRL